MLKNEQVKYAHLSEGRHYKHVKDAMPYEVLVTVKEVRVDCAAHKVGDKIKFTRDRRILGKICFSALASMMYKIIGMRYDTRYPWLDDPDVATHLCPAVDSPVVFEIRRIREKD